MKSLLLSFAIFACTYLSAQTVYIVRHGEKAVPSSMDDMAKKDPPLSDEGTARAEALLALFKDEKIKITHVFSTPYKRTRATVEPTRAWFQLTTKDYQWPQDAELIAALGQKGASVLIAGHSNTLDDLVNEIIGEKKLADLPDSQYDNLYVLVKENGKWRFENRKYGTASE